MHVKHITQGETVLHQYTTGATTPPILPLGSTLVGLDARGTPFEHRVLKYTLDVTGGLLFIQVLDLIALRTNLDTVEG